MKPYIIFFSSWVWVLGLGTPASAAEENGVTQSPATASSGVEVGVARQDGVTVSGGEVYVTRHRATEKLVKDLELPSGVTVRPDGTVILANGTRAALQADQLLTMDGRIVAMPQDVNLNSATGVAGTVRTPVVAASAVSPSAGAPPVGSGDRGTFIGSDGIPFVGTITSPGMITKDNGQTVPIDGSIRTLTPGIGVPMETHIALDGSITTLAGTIIHPDGTVRTKDGTIIWPRSEQGKSSRQEPVPQLNSVAPEGTVNGQIVNPNQITPVGAAGAPVLPRESIPPNNGGATGGAPLHPGGPAPVGQYGR